MTDEFKASNPAKRPGDTFASFPAIREYMRANPTRDAGGGVRNATSVGQLLQLNEYQRRLTLEGHSQDAKLRLAHLASLGLKRALDQAASYQELIQQLTDEEE